ncbi:MAG: adenylate/guanylate cyclase domain-containing protein [Rhodospirillaceae bacterium]
MSLFVLLTVPVLAAIIVVNYVANDRIARANGQELVERFRLQAIDSVREIFDPIKSMVRVAATLGEQQGDFYADNRSMKYFETILQHSPRIVSAYVGLNDGQFRQTRRLNPDAELFGKKVPAGTRYSYHWLEYPNGGGAVDHNVFLDVNGQGLGAQQAPTAYDPRNRMWYRATVEANGLYITDPDVFATLGLIGFTVAQPFSRDGEVRGVVAIDITLDGLSQYIAEHKVSPNTLSYVLDQDGRVLAASDLSKTYAADKGKVDLRHISDLENELPALAYGAHPRNGGGTLYNFSHGGREYFASLSTLPADFGKHWQLFIVTPVADFTGAFDRNNRLLLTVGMVATLVALIVIYLLSGMLSAPLERLAAKVSKIEKMDGESLPLVRSRVREIDVLARAIDTLDSAVKSFASFVPVGLVRELLTTDAKSQLGGHSRFLTVLFSDLEDFSSLSERIPSQALLQHVSRHLELVIRSINQEHGTIDKFMGDGVMAFWGAPALLEDHAFRACVSALRIQHGMADLNARWQAEGAEPLRVRIGIHSDAVLVGNIGSRERMSYTVLGDGVNVAARLEGVNKEFRTTICISHAAFREAGENLCVRPIDEVTVKGRRGLVPIYELLGAWGAGPELEPTPQAERLAELTRVAHAALLRRDTACAMQGYRAVLCEFPDDPVAQVMVKRLAEG